MADLTCAGDQSGCCARTRAPTPAAKGVDMDVPDSRRNCCVAEDPGVLATDAPHRSTPGAVMSGFRMLLVRPLEVARKEVGSTAGPVEEKEAI